MNKRKLARTWWIAGLSGAAASGLLAGCVRDSDCGVCDPDNLILESITGVNYTNTKVHLLSPDCEGDSCPDPFDKGTYFIEEIGPCEETEDATSSSRPDDYCLMSPMIVFGGVEFVFNNLLDPTSIELVRKRPDNPQLFEVYDWKSQIAEIHGPQTRFNGDYIDGEIDTIHRATNLTCIEKLDGFDAEDVGTDICEAVERQGDQLVPLKMEVDAVIKSYRGETDWRGGSCDTPDEGADTCCTVCDYELSVNVAKYGLVAAGGEKAGPGNGALLCDPDGDKFLANAAGGCAEFVPWVDRADEETTYTYDWGGQTEVGPIPRYDRLRELHPDDRPAGIEHSRANCQTDQDCDLQLGSLSGAECVGRLEDSGGACAQDTMDERCVERHCVAEWFVDCYADTTTTGMDGYCIDRRFKDRGAGACYEASKQFERCDAVTGDCENVPAGQRLAHCDGDDNAFMTATECCQDPLGGGASCDPLFQPFVAPVSMFDRNSTLPEETRDCYCGDPSEQREECASLIQQFCTAPWGDAVPSEKEADPDWSNEDHYITRFVTKVGGVVYDPAIKGVDWRAGDLGGEPRALVETCAEQAGEIDKRNVMDGWRAGDAKGFETYENFDRALCSGQEYEIVFQTKADAEEGPAEYVEDKVGNTLDGKNRYRFRTPQFHVVPGSGFPTDNLRIGACDSFEMSFSNKFDLDPRNLAKLELWELELTGCDDEADPTCWEASRRIAGGTGCSEDRDEVIDSGGTIAPCLTVDVSDQWLGTARVGLDRVRFGKFLYEAGDTDHFGQLTSGRYRMVAPGLEERNAKGVATRSWGSLDELAEDHPVDSAKFREVYQGAFQDACGMPLIKSGYEGDLPDYLYDFSIDSPKCKEDQDVDGAQLSCDNAGNHYNPDQADADEDGFGDVVDVCVVVESATNTADSDDDGIGNDCDNCRLKTDTYNENAMMAGVPAYLWVRNQPWQSDFDHDGVGDVCDNCPGHANCENYGPANEWEVGDPIDVENDNTCQSDVDLDMIGDVCAGMMLPEAAGAIGFGNDDDFDQDGVINIDDACPRMPVTAVACTSDDECQTGEQCMDGVGTNMSVCNHRDTDGDGVGDLCDTCPYTGNAEQTMDGGMQDDDQDGDFVGRACESYSECYIRKDPRPYAFFEVSVDGACCTTVYPGDGAYILDDMGMVLKDDEGRAFCEGLCDPDGLPIKRDCQNEPEKPEDRFPDGVQCRQLPMAVLMRPGIVELPPGCEEALTAAGQAPDGSENLRLTQVDFDGDLVAMWDSMCFLPQWDQDFDGIGDACELKPTCEHAFDPNGEFYIDANGKVWDDAGKYCSGAYDIEEVCARTTPPGTGDETGETGGTGETGETGETGGTGGTGETG
jgi:hypothetical protein